MRKPATVLQKYGKGSRQDEHAVIPECDCLLLSDLSIAFSHCLLLLRYADGCYCVPLGSLYAGTKGPLNPSCCCGLLLLETLGGPMSKVLEPLA